MVIRALRVASLAGLACIGLIVACGDSATTPDAPGDAPNAGDAATNATPSAPSDAACASCTDTGAAGVDATSDAAAPFVAIFSAFPAEMVPLVAATNVDTTKTIAGHTVRIGTLKGVRVALTLTGMGLGSATSTAHDVLAQLPVTGVVFSGVAGSKLRIGDVAVPTSWSLKGTTTYAPDAKWLALATSLVASGSLCLEQCTVVPATGVPVCMDHVPAAGVGGAGQSDDTSVPVTCKSGGDDVFGCDVDTSSAAANQCKPMGAAMPDGGATSGPLINDNETAAVASEAAARHLPFIAFRGVSDGASDPLGLPGYPAQFFAYYRLAARNAAATTTAFVERLAAAP